MPPPVPYRVQLEASAERGLTLRLTADGFVYVYTPSQSLELQRSEGDTVRIESKGQGVERAFVSVDWTRVSTLWGDLIEQHPILADPSGEVRILYPASHYVIIPSGMSGSQDVHWWRLTAPIFADEHQYYNDTCTLGDGKPSLAVGCSRLLKGFLQRSFVAYTFAPTVLPFARYALRHSSMQACLSLGVELVESGCDLIVCQSGQLLRANHYSWSRYRSWQHHLYQVLYFLSKVYLDSSIDHAVPVSVILSDGTAGADALAQDLLNALHRQFSTAGWTVSIAPSDYWYT